MTSQYPPPSPSSGGTAGILPAEREKCSFDIKDLQTVFGRSSSGLTAEYRKLFSGPPFDDAHLDHYRSYEAQFEKQIERAAAAARIARSNPKFLKDHMAQRVSMGAMFSSGALGIHFIAYLPFLETQANEEQRKMWLNGARALEYVGIYAQTELGHGSNVRALETTATFDEATDEFVIHSPTLTSIKWWPTAMYAATHAVVFAQLISKGHNYGFHGFFMQFRDDQGRTMPGVEVGEIGPKIDGETNIGYARFTYVRVPRFNLFAKNASFTREGEYVAPPPKLSKFSYIGMLNIRMGMVQGAFGVIAHAATIAVRYLCIRKQGFLNSTNEDALSGGERTVLDYQLHQYRTFKAIGFAYMFFFSVKYVRELMKKVREGVMAGDESAADGMPELNATLSGMKCFCTTIAHANVEALRRSCGGQGFLRAAGLSEHLGNAAAAVTAEGEHVTLAMQLVRFLVKSVREVKTGQNVVGSLEYLKEAPLTRAETQDGRALAPEAPSDTAQELLLRMLRDRARRLAYRLEEAFSAAERKGGTFDDALNRCMNVGYKAAEAHTIFVLARNNYEIVARMPVNPVRTVLLRVFELTGLQQVWDNSGDFVHILAEEVADTLVIERINQLLETLRPDAVGLVDGMGVSDANLKSTVGKYDGNVYEEIYEAAKRSPLNQAPQMVGWDHLKTVVDLDFIKEGMQIQRQGATAQPKL